MVFGVQAEFNSRLPPNEPHGARVGTVNFNVYQLDTLRIIQKCVSKIGQIGAWEPPLPARLIDRQCHQCLRWYDHPRSLSYFKFIDRAYSSKSLSFGYI